MSAGALVFLAGSWSAVLGLTAWCFRRILAAPPRSGGAAE